MCIESCGNSMFIYTNLYMLRLYSNQGMFCLFLSIGGIMSSLLKHPLVSTLGLKWYVSQARGVS